MKKGRASEQSIKHGNQASKEHAADMKKSKALGEKRKLESEGCEWVRVKSDSNVRAWEGGEGYENFKSDLGGLGIGECFNVTGGINLGEDYADASSASLNEVKERANWEQGLMAAMKNFDHYHALQPRIWKNKKKEKGTKAKGQQKEQAPEGVEKKEEDQLIQTGGYWPRRKINDRVTVKPAEKMRPNSDVERETIDLRPDASRAIQYMVEAGLKDEVNQVLDEVRLYKVKLFEEIYGRKAIYVAEHTDAGQHHDDIWHHGIFEKEVSSGLKGKKKRVRDRIPFRSYGISVGACSWGRHFSALMESGMSSSRVKELTGETWDLVEEDIQKVQKRYEAPPRDLKLLKELDLFVSSKLRGIDQKAYERANSEYAEWIQKGYEQGKLGKRKPITRGERETNLKLKEEKEKTLKLREELESMKELYETLKETLDDERGLRAELESRLARVTEWVAIVFRSLGKKLLALVNTNPAAKDCFKSLQDVVEGKEIPPTAAEAVAKLSKEMEGPTQPE
jgi:hypothetical protein